MNNILSYVKMLVCIWLCICQSKTQAQYYFYNEKYYDSKYIVELGVEAGGINCLTDIGGNKGRGGRFIKDINWNNTQYCINMYAGVLINNVVSIRLSGTLGKVKAYDSILHKYRIDNGSKGRYDRNLHFYSSITEISLVSEFHPLMLLDCAAEKPIFFSPYITAGIGRFAFDPKAYYQGRWLNLQPLRLEGQGFQEYPGRQEYALHATCFSLGAGIRYEISEKLAARLEVTHRFTNTDYLDDVSRGRYILPALFATYLSPVDAYFATQLFDRHGQRNPDYVPNTNAIRGNSGNNDAYFTYQLGIGFTLGRQKRS